MSRRPSLSTSFVSASPAAPLAKRTRLPPANNRSLSGASIPSRKTSIAFGPVLPEWLAPYREIIVQYVDFSNNSNAILRFGSGEEQQVGTISHGLSICRKELERLAKAQIRANPSYQQALDNLPAIEPTDRIAKWIDNRFNQITPASNGVMVIDNDEGTQHLIKGWTFISVYLMGCNPNAAQFALLASGEIKQSPGRLARVRGSSPEQARLAQSGKGSVNPATPTTRRRSSVKPVDVLPAWIAPWAPVVKSFVNVGEGAFAKICITFASGGEEWIDRGKGEGWAVRRARQEMNKRAQLLAKADPGYKQSLSKIREMQPGDARRAALTSTSALTPGQDGTYISLIGEDVFIQGWDYTTLRLACLSKRGYVLLRDGTLRRSLGKRAQMRK